MPKRVCQQALDVEGVITQCENDATMVTWLSTSQDVGVYACDEHYDHTYQGWITRGGTMRIERRVSGFVWKGDGS
jgi:hypothetical protein